MTSEIEKQFFKTLGIEPRKYWLCTSGWDCIDAQPCEQCHYGKLIEDEYPKITDHTLLELICILNQNTTLDETYYQGAVTVKELRKLVLKDLIKTKDNFDTIQQVQALFKEDNNE